MIDLRFWTEFRAGLSPAALALVDKPKHGTILQWDEPTVVDGKEDRVRRFCRAQYFAKRVQHPFDSWYARKLGGLLNWLVDRGHVRGFWTAGAIPLAGRDAIVATCGAPDAGPDEYDCVFMFIHTERSREELNALLNDECFQLEGHVGHVDGPWLAICRTLAK